MPPLAYEVLEGFVERINEGGFVLLNRWFNYGERWTGPQVKAGDQVKIRVRGKYLVHLVPIDQELPPEPPPRARTLGFQRSPEEERRALRAACLQSAVAWLAAFHITISTEVEAHRRPTSTDVLALGARFEQWVYRQEGV